MLEKSYSNNTYHRSIENTIILQPSASLLLALLRHLPQRPPQNLSTRRLWYRINKHNTTPQLFITRHLITNIFLNLLLANLFRRMLYNIGPGHFSLLTRIVNTNDTGV